MSGSTLLVLSYLLLAIFAAGFVLRTVKLARMPLHLRWELAPVPHERGKGRYGGSYFEEFEWWTRPRQVSLVAEAAYMLQEILFLKAVREHNPRLWWFSFPFHVGLYLLAVISALLLGAAGLELAGVAATAWAGLRVAITAAGAAGCALGLVGATGLLGKRLFDPRLRDFTTPASLLHLVLLLALFASGAVALATTPYPAAVTAYLHGLLTADPSTALGGALAVHLMVGLLFLAYLPFSRMMHFVAKFFTYHQVRWDDAPMRPGSAMEKEIQAVLAQPVTWAAPHLGADGRKNWVDLATEEAAP